MPVVVWAAELYFDRALSGGAAALLTLPICLVLTHFAAQREAFHRPPSHRRGAEWALGAVVVLLAGALYAARAEPAALFLAGALLPPAVWICIWGAAGWTRARSMSVPVFFAYFSLPWEFFARGALDERLQIWSADIAVAALRLVDYPIRVWDEVTFYTDAYYVVVDETCSGMNMLVTLGMYTFLFGWFVQPALRSRVILLIVVVPLAMFANGLRVASIYLMGHYGGKELADGFWHTGGAYLIFIPVFWFLYVVNQALTDRARRARNAMSANTPSDSQAHQSPQRTNGV